MGIKVAQASCTLGLGSNVGDRARNLQAALDALAKVPGLELTACSPVYLTEPIDCLPGSPAFLNTVAEGSYAGDVYGLLAHTQALESRLGRTRSRLRNAPRLIDIDLLTVGTVVLQDSRLTLPHPRLEERLFVLRPLADLRPHFTLPGGARIGQVIQALVEKGQSAAPWDGPKLELR